MSNAETIAKSTAFIFIGELSTRALSLGLVVAIAHYLGEIGLGAYAFAFAFTDLLLQFADLGIPNYLIKEIARNKARTSSYISETLGLRLSIVPLILLAGLAAAYLFQAKSLETRIIIILATAGTAFNFLTEPLRSVYIAHERNAYYAALTIFERLLFTSGGLALLLTGQGLMPVLGLYLFSQIISFLTNLLVVRKNFVKFNISFNKASSTGLVKKALPFWLTNLFRTLYLRVDILILSAMKGFAVTGWYGAAYRLTESLTLIPLAVVTAIFPTMSQLHAQSKETLKALYGKAFYYLLLAAIPIAVGTTLVANRAIMFLYGQAFAPSIIALQLLIWAEALLFIHFIMGFLLNSIDKQHLFTIVTVIYAAANVALNLILIPRYSYVGAATAAIITQAIAAVTLYYLCTKNGYGLNLPKLIFKPAVAATVMAAALIWLKSLHLLILVPIAAAAYITTLFAIRGVGKEEIGLIKKIAFWLH